MVEQLSFDPDNKDEDEICLALIQIEFYNPTQKKLIIDLTAFHLESNEFSIQFFYPLMLHYNNLGMYLTLTPSERKILLLPDPLQKVLFTADKWDSVKSRRYYMVTSLYPEKTLAKVKFE